MPLYIQKKTSFLTCFLIVVVHSMCIYSSVMEIYHEVSKTRLFGLLMVKDERFVQ